MWLPEKYAPVQRDTRVMYMPIHHSFALYEK